MQQVTPLEAVLRRDRAVVMAGILGVVALAWAYMLYLAWDMRVMNTGAGMAMARAMSWSIVDFVTTFVMWAVMMTAMMVSTAAPMILVFATVNRRRREQERPFVPTSVFLGGYLIVWFGMAIVATLAQWSLHQATLMTSMMGSVTPVLDGTLLLAAGVFQWTPLKYACLRHCQTPIGFIMAEWREGTQGALSMVSGTARFVSAVAGSSWVSCSWLG